MLYLISWLTDFAAFLFLFAGNRYLADQESDVLGILGASFFLASAIANTSAGMLADRFGRRRVSLIGAIVFVLTVALVALTGPSGWFFYAAYTLVGASLGTIYPPLMAWLSVRHSGKHSSRAFLFFCLSFNLGLGTAQVCGGWMYENWGSTAPLYGALIAAALSLTCISTLPAAVEQGKPKKEKTDPQVASRANTFAYLAWFANFGGMFSMSTVWFLFPNLAVALKVSPSTHGAALAIGRAVVMSIYCMMYFNTHWQFRFRYSLIAQVAGCAGLLGLCLSSSAVGLTISIGGLSTLLGYNYFASLFYNAKGAADDRKGRAFGVNEAFLAFGAGGGSLFGGLAAPYFGIRAPYQMAMCVVGVMATIQCMIYFFKKRRASRL